MRVFATNFVDASGVVFTPTSEASVYLAVENIAHEHKAKVWRTGTSTAVESVVIDFLNDVAPTSVIIFNHNFTASDSNLVLRASSDNFATVDDLISTLTFSADYTYLHATFGAATYRYFKFQFTKAAAGQTRDVGRIFLGNYTDLNNAIAFEGVKIKPTDLSVGLISAGGQTYTDRRSQFRTVQLDLNSLTTTEKDALRTITNTVGTHQSFWMQIDQSATTELSEVLYVKFKDLPERGVSGLSSDVVWDLKAELREQL